MDSQKVTKKPRARDRQHRAGSLVPRALETTLPPAHSTPPGTMVHVRDPRGMRDLPLERGRRAEDYEFQIITVRSEERRVGKEWRCGWGRGHANRRRSEHGSGAGGREGTRRT